MPRPSPPSAQNRARDTARAADGRTTGPQSSQPSRHARARGATAKLQPAAMDVGERAIRDHVPGGSGDRVPQHVGAVGRGQVRLAPPAWRPHDGAAVVRRPRPRSAPWPRPASTGTGRAVPRQAAAKRCFGTDGGRVPPRDDAARGVRRPDEGGEESGAERQRHRPHATDSPPPRAARRGRPRRPVRSRTARRPGPVAFRVLGAAELPPRHGDPEGLDAEREDGPPQRDAEQRRPRERGDAAKQDDGVHVRAICAIVSRRDCWMCRGPLLVPVVARTLRGSEGKSGRCSCERSPATAPRGPLTWESQGAYRMSSAPFCVGWPPAGRARAGLARLDGESPGSTGRRGISIRSRCRIPSARVRRGCCRPRRGGTSRTSCRWPPSS